MSQEIRVRQTPREHEFAATVTEGVDTTRHRVTISEDFLDDLGMLDVDEQAMARETIAFLLDRLPGDALPEEIDLDEVARVHDDFIPELRTRLTP
jgi:ADP-ribose pyrophosphatase YjhB (NUDIX family)